MGEIIYWKEFDEPKPIKRKRYSPIGVEEYDSFDYGEIVCKDDRIKEVRFFITFGENGKDVISAVWFTFKNGESKYFNLSGQYLKRSYDLYEMSINDEQRYLEAEQYLKQLK